MTTPISSPPGAAATTGAAPASPPPGGALGKDAFMQLLVAQMRYQNPMSPVDGQQYMAQLAQFAQVEKLEAIVKGQADAAAWQKVVASQSMVGKQITGVGPTGTLVTGVASSVTFSSGGPRVHLPGGVTLAVEDVQTVAAPGTNS